MLRLTGLFRFYGESGVGQSDPFWNCDTEAVNFVGMEIGVARLLELACCNIAEHGDEVGICVGEVGDVLGPLSVEIDGGDG